MQSYIKKKGVIQKGPLIQYTSMNIKDNQEVDLKITLMMQCNNYIHSTEEPYSMESLIRVQNCMYCRYNGPQEKLKLAYDKINVEAFETDGN